MAKFEYQAQDKKGMVYKGTVTAETEAVVRLKLREHGLYTTAINKKKEQYRLIFKDRIKTEDIVIFTERLSVLINAGLPIIRSLQTIGKQTENRALKNVIYGLRLELEGGATFSEALSKQHKVFSDLYVNLVKAGETGGVMDQMLMKISEYLNKDSALRKNIKRAFTYPAIVISVAIIVVTFLVIFIVPVFAKTYQSMRLSLPLPTLFLIGMSKFAANFWWLILMVIFLFLLGYNLIKKSDRGSLAIDNLKLKAPIFGSLNCKVVISRFIHTLGLLVASGVPIMEALGVAREVSNNKVMENIIDKVKVRVRDGGKISEFLLQEQLFSPMVVQMVAVGEEAGVLDKMLKKSADLLERDVDDAVQKLTAYLEPVLTFLLAIIIGFIALAIYLPMFDLISSITK